jgi:hypothetical protein
MRTFGLNLLLFLVFAAIALSPSRGAAAAATSDFLSWALDRSGECDVRWRLIAGSGDAHSSPIDGTDATTTNWLPSGVNVMVAGALSHTVISTRSFIHGVSNNERYLPLSTRPWEDAARVGSALQNPAQAQLSVPNEMIRPLNSSVQQKNFFQDYGTSISRPRLNSFGRISADHPLYNGAVARPAWSSDHPHNL